MSFIYYLKVLLKAFLVYFTDIYKSILTRDSLFQQDFYANYFHINREKPSNLLEQYLNSGWHEDKNPFLLFDLNYYKKYPHELKINIFIKSILKLVYEYPWFDPVLHYIHSGWKKGFNPHPLFNTHYYLTQQKTKIINNPLSDFLEIGHKRKLNPHPLFDISYYIENNPSVKSCNLDPLSHFLSIGWKENRNPNLLFDIDYYVKNNSLELEITHLNPVLHFLQIGWIKGLNPHELFDVKYYKGQFPEGHIWTIDPLSHYIAFGWLEGKNPHPLFDTNFYRNENLNNKEIEPLSHYLTFGFKDKKSPHPLFDIIYYFNKYQDIESAGIEPLSHYIKVGWKENRSPHPLFNIIEYKENMKKFLSEELEPLRHFIEHGWKMNISPNNLISIEELKNDNHHIIKTFITFPSFIFERNFFDSLVIKKEINIRKVFNPALLDKIDSKKIILLIAHFSFGNPRAGNEQRLRKLIEYLIYLNYNPFLIIYINNSANVSNSNIKKMLNMINNLLVIYNDGFIDVSLSALQLLEWEISLQRHYDLKYFIKDYIIFKRNDGYDNYFLSPYSLSIINYVSNKLRPKAVITSYIFSSNVLEFVKSDIIKIIDTHDLFFNYDHMGIDYKYTYENISKEQEVRLLNRADIIIAIQNKDRSVLENILPIEKKVITVGVDFQVKESEIIESPKILFLASNNYRNIIGINEFLKYSWKAIKKEVPKAELIIAGGIVKSSESILKGSSVKFSSLAQEKLYVETKLVINPVLYGTGLKIKTIEAISHLKPIVLWETGLDGLPDRFKSLCFVASDWSDFSQKVTMVLKSNNLTWYSNEEKEYLKFLFDKDNVYKELREVLNEIYH